MQTFGWLEIPHFLNRISISISTWTAERKKLYDDKKVQLVSGVTLLIFGILTGLDMVIKSYVYDIIYLAAVIVIFIIMVVVIRKKCKK